MASIEKTNQLQAFSSESVSRLWQDTEHYLSFLKTSARLYKYGFADQVLIHAHRPDAVACAEYATWSNNDIHRYVKRGSKGIPLLAVDRSGRQSIRYVFDFADTGARDERSKEPYFWEVNPANTKAVLNTLGTSADNAADALSEKARKIVREQAEDYLRDLKDSTADTFLEEYDELNLTTRFTELLEKSVTYSLYSRCGIDTNGYFEKDDFRGLAEFNGIEAMTVLGTAVSDISEQILRSIEKTLKAERRKEYDRSVAESKDRNAVERTDNHIYSLGGVTGLYSFDGASAAEGDRALRENAAGVPEGTPQGAVSVAPAERNAERTLDGDRRDDAAAVGADVTDDVGESERDGAAQSTGPNGMGRSDEQREAGSGGNNSARTDLQLNNGTAEFKSSAFSMPEHLIDGILKNDMFFKVKCDDVVKFFLTNEDAAERAEFMKNVFNSEYSELDIDDVRCGYKAWVNDRNGNPDGLELWVGNYLTKTEDARLSWKDVSQRVGSLIEAHEYLEAPDVFDIEPNIGEDGGEAYQLSLFDTDDTADISAVSKAKPIKAELNPALEIAITREILRGTDTEQSKLRILDFYRQNNPDTKEFAKFLKQEHGIYHGHSGYDDSVIKFATYEGKGVTFEVEQDGERSEYKLSWEKIASRNAELLKNNDYISAEDIDGFVRASRWHLKSGLYPAERETGILKRFGMDGDGIIPSFSFSADKFDLETAIVDLSENNDDGYLAEVEINFNHPELLERLSLNGLNPPEKYDGRLIYETDGKDWNRIVLPDVYGNKWKNIPVSLLLRSDEITELAKVNEKIAEIANDHRRFDRENEMLDNLTAENLESGYDGITAEGELTAVRVGDFYEFHGDDARLAADLLGITLTTRQGEPMTGIPVYAVEQYERQLYDKGYELTLKETDELTVNAPAAEEKYITEWYICDEDGEPLSDGYSTKEEAEAHLPDYPEADFVEGFETLIDSTAENSFEFTIGFTESPLLRQFMDANYPDRKIPFALANELVKYLDKKTITEYESEGGGYDKTDFEIQAVIGGEDYGYDGRFDIGGGSVSRDGDTIIEHIRKNAEWVVNDKTGFNTDEGKAAARNTLDVLVPFLGKYSELSAEEKNILDEFKKQNPIKGKVKAMSELSEGDVIRLPSSTMLDRNLKPVTVSESYAVVKSANEKEINLDTYSDKELTHKTGVAGYLVNWAEQLEKTGAEYIGRYEDITATRDDTPLVNETVDMSAAVLLEFRGNTESLDAIRERALSLGATVTAEKERDVLYIETSEANSGELKGMTGEIDATVKTLPYGTLADMDKAAENRAMAFERLKSNHDFKPIAIEVLDRIEKQMQINNYDKFDLQMLRLPLFQHKYGMLPRISKTIFDDKLKEIAAELNGYLESAAVENTQESPKELSVGDRFRNKATGEISEVVSLTGALPWYTDDCTVTRESGNVVVTGNIGKKDLLDGETYEFIGNNTITVDTSEPVKLNSVVIDLTASDEPSRENDRETLENVDSPMANNFRITDENLGAGGAKVKYRANIEAIKLLRELESENRQATSDEQEILSRYVGWGGLSQAFDENNKAWANEYAELKALLSPEEYNSARASTPNAHYTSPTVINAVYKGLENLGFGSGNVLEPAMGVGNFFGCMPEEMRGSKLFGVELDSITGRIAKQIYPGADIQIKGFEETAFPDNFFDVAVGNVPFGGYKLSEKRYDKLSLQIHDHFFAKSLDKVRAGGVIAFVTSKGTLDKESPKFRKYLAQRAELLGAIRLPNNAFTENAGTEVTSDIIFLQKCDKILENSEPDWVQLGKTADGVPVNKYFEQHPEMILGKMKQGAEFSLYGDETQTACVPIEGASLKEQLAEAVKNIQGTIPEIVRNEKEEKAPKSIDADTHVRNFSFTVVKGDIYYRENDRMYLQELPEKTAERVKGMIGIRDCTRKLIDRQLNECDDVEIKQLQRMLNRLYDNFTEEYGLINSRENVRAFSDDSSMPLLSSLEILDEEGNLDRKADMFTKRTIKPQAEITHVDTVLEALVVSVAEKTKVDIPFMAQLCGKTEAEVIKECSEANAIFELPAFDQSERGVYVTADEYLSGNIREKISLANLASFGDESFTRNVEALKQVMPEPLTASEIDVRIGATWIDPEIYKQFIFETLKTPRYLGNKINVDFCEYTSEWNISNKSNDSKNVLANTTYGTTRANAYSIIEDALNLRDTRVYDAVRDSDGKTKYVLNHDETTLAQEKQDALKQAFKDWIFKDPERREQLVNKYNELFNSTRPREYDGAHLRLTGMSPEIKLRPHQLNAIAHTIYGGNTLLAHQVGAGKTFEMVAAAMESKRLGLCSKSLFAVPNHLTEQWGAEFMRLYPSANILVATAKDFEAKNRKRLCSKIATGDYDAIIIGHSQLKKIPISPEREKRMIERQIEDIAEGIRILSGEQESRYSVKRLEVTKKNLQARLKRLADVAKRDDVVTFEELGVDRLFIDEAHEFKNLFLYTKMRNVAGIGQTEAEKSSDLYNKCQYLDEVTGGRGTIFATGTPISNTMSELYTMMRYLQSDTLSKMRMQNFDAWAANFGEPVTAIELAPEGTGYRAKTRFSRFFNLPELMNIFKEAADIKMSDELNLDVPTAHFHNIAVLPSELQKDMVQELSERAAAVHNKKVTPDVDNMLKITSDGRKIGLDQRLMNPNLPDNPDSKVNVCVNNVFDIYTKTAEKKSTQIVFCDFSTPNGKGFNLYDDIRDKLIAKGVAKEEIAFIHDADSEAKKKELFAKVRSGKVRVLLGSTAKCGAGMNVQDKLVAIHHLDCPWRPSDLEQREGRIIRQGNENKDVDIFRYVTEATFDAYLYQTIENKQRFISQIMTSKSPVRSCEDVDEATLSYAEVKALCAGNPLIKEKMDLDIAVAKLKVLKSSYISQRYTLEDKIIKEYPNQIVALEKRIAAYEKDLEHLRTVKAPDEGISPMIIAGKAYTDKEKAGEALESAMKTVKSTTDKYNIGSYKGFDMYLSYSSFGQQFTLDLKREGTHSIVLGGSKSKNLTRIDNLLDSIEKRIEGSKEQLKMVHEQREEAKAELAKPFAHEQELADKSARLAQLNAELNLDAGANGSDISADERPSLLGQISDIKKLSKEKDKGNEKNPEKGDTAKGDDRRAI